VQQQPLAQEQSLERSVQEAHMRLEQLQVLVQEQKPQAPEQLVPLQQVPV
jgi:hypothetical protein